MATASSGMSTRRLLGPLRRGSVDERLVADVRAGDERAFEAIFDRYHAPLLAFCRHMLGNQQEAEDALQHVFMAAHQHLRAGDRGIQLKPWLYAIARNRCLDVLRARRESVALESVHEPATDGLALAGEVERRHDLKELLADIGRLPEEQRAALVLAELGDLSHDEIAAALDVRTGKVKALIFQARESLLARREARAADCGDIRRQLATLQGGALRRKTLRLHLDSCPACAAYEQDVRRQRAALALILPVVPAAGLKESVLSAALGGGGAASGAAVAGTAAAGSGAVAAAGAGSSGLAVKALVAVAVAAGAGGGGVVTVRELERAADSTPAAVTAPVQAGAHPSASPSAPATHGGREQGTTSRAVARPSERGRPDERRPERGRTAGKPASPGAKGRGRAAAKSHGRADPEHHGRAGTRGRGSTGKPANTPHRAARKPKPNPPWRGAGKRPAITRPTPAAKAPKLAPPAVPAVPAVPATPPPPQSSPPPAATPATPAVPDAATRKSPKGASGSD